MTLDPDFELADVGTDGSIFMGRILCSDGYNYNRTNSVFTHIHSDHLGDFFNQALHRCQIYTTKETRDLLSALKNESYDKKRQFHTVALNDPKTLVKGEELNYETMNVNTAKMIGDENYKEKLTLLPSNHMLGACSVKLLTPDNITIGYSGDFSSEDEPPKCDILIIDSTHGAPHFNIKNLDVPSLERRLLDYVEEHVSNGRPVVIHANRGKLQEIMDIISTSKEIAKSTRFFCGEEDLRIARVYSKYGFEIRELQKSTTDDASDYRNGENTFVEFISGFNERRYEISGKAFSIKVRSYSGNQDIKETDDEVTFEMSDHAQFDDIIEYVRKSGAKKIVVEGSGKRSRLGVKLTSYLKDKGFDAFCRPTPQFT